MAPRLNVVFCMYMKKPFLHACGAALYIVAIVLIAQAVGTVLKNLQDTIVIPMTMLSLFVLSAAVMGYLFLAEPLSLLMENRKKDAIVFFGKTVGFFACFVLVFTVTLFFQTPRATVNTPNEVPMGKLNINVVCESALSYMTFTDGASADAFVAECKEGKHPEVIERYKADMNLGDGATI